MVARKVDAARIAENGLIIQGPPPLGAASCLQCRYARKVSTLVCGAETAIGDPCSNSSLPGLERPARVYVCSISGCMAVECRHGHASPLSSTTSALTDAHFPWQISSLP